MTKRKLLIIVDLQDGFITEQSKGIPAKVAKYLDEHSSDYDEIVATRYTNNPQSSCYTQLGWKGCMEEKDYQLVSEIRGRDLKVFDKDTYSAITPEVEEWLLQKEIYEVDVCGIATGCCVLATAYSLFDKGYPVNVLLELSSSTLVDATYDKYVDKLVQENLNCK